MSITTDYPFRNTELPPEEQARDLVSRFMLEEKIALMVQYQPAVERLGVKPYKHGTEAAHGIAWLGEATSFPQPIGLACTWNPELLKRIGSAIGDEARVFYQRNPAVNGLTLWAPTVDMERDPRWGRTEEAYGEDPKLTGELAAALVQGIQGDHPVYKKAVATLKHFLGNNNEAERGSCSVSIDPRNMREYYQKPFEAAFVQGGALSMMTSYNAVNGVPTILHEDVRRIVKEKWGMNGFVVSDAGDLLGIVNDHRYYDTYKEAVAHAIKAGIDSITDDRDKSLAAIEEALKDGLLQEADLDRALVHTFGVRIRLGEFDPEEANPYANTPEAKVCSPEHAELSLQAARESIVLLKNERGILPLSKKTGKIAVIGPLADVVYRDWYSGTLPYKITPLEGIRGKLADAEAAYRSGNDRIWLRTAPGGRPIRLDPEGRLTAAEAALSDGVDAQGEIFELTDWGWGSFTLRSETTGKFATSADDVHVAAAADEAFGWYVKEAFKLDREGSADESFVLRTWNGRPVTATGDGALAVRPEGEAGPPDRYTAETVCRGLEEAVAAAREAETAIVFVGNNPLINGKEEVDRADITLAESQERLIREVFAANPNTVVVAIGSYPFALNWAQENVPAIVYSSHAGQELGRAVADVLFGDYNPAGRLNMTWYRSAEQLPDIMDYDIRKGKRTYLYFDGEPLYPFGHGLSYASFAYEALEVSGCEDPSKEEWTVRARVTNTGSIAGDEVAQLYVRADSSRVERPLKQLAAFTRLRLEAGETRTIEWRVRTAELALWDVTRDRFCLEAGEYTLMAGASSADIRLAETVTAAGETIPPRRLDGFVPADRYDDYEGVRLEECKEGGTAVTAPGGQGRINFSGVSFAEAPARFEARVSGGEQGGTITVRFGGSEAAVAQLAAEPDDGLSWRTIAVPAAADCALSEEVTLELSGTVKISKFALK